MLIYVYYVWVIVILLVDVVVSLFFNFLFFGAGFFVVFFQAEDGIRDAQESRGLGDVYKRQALDQTSGCIIAEMVGRGSGFGSTYGAQTSIGLLPILYWGSEELKKQWIPGIISGEIVSAYCLTESLSLIHI